MRRVYTTTCQAANINQICQPIGKGIFTRLLLIMIYDALTTGCGHVEGRVLDQQDDAMKRGDLCSTLRDVTLAIVQDPLLAAPSIIVIGMASLVAVAQVLFS